jgi:hypothetical protein
MNNCPECGQSDPHILPRWNRVSKKEVAKMIEKGQPHTIKADENCQTCIQARLDALSSFFGTAPKDTGKVTAAAEVAVPLPVK